MNYRNDTTSQYKEQDTSSKLKSVRMAMGVRIEDMASRVFVSRETIRQWELGKRVPDVAYFINLADSYHLTIPELVDCLSEFQPWMKELFDRYTQERGG